MKFKIRAYIDSKSTINYIESNYIDITVNDCGDGYTLVVSDHDSVKYLDFTTTDMQVLVESIDCSKSYCCDSIVLTLVDSAQLTDQIELDSGQVVYNPSIEGYYEFDIVVENAGDLPM